jgi:hypothetical protein
MPTGAFWGGLLEGIGGGVQKEQERRRKEEDQARQTELALLSKVHFEELDPAMQEQLVGRQLKATYGHLKGKQLDQAMEPWMNLFRSTKPPDQEGGAATPSLDMRPLPTPATMQGATQPSWEMGPTGDADMPEIGALPVPLTPGAFQTAASQVVRASPGQARPVQRRFGPWGPSYAQREEMKTEREVAGEREKGKARNEEQEARQRRMLDLLPTLGLSEEDQRLARMAILTGQMPSSAAPRESQLDYEVEKVIDPNTGKPRFVTRRQAADFGLEPYQTPARDSAAEARRAERIRAKVNLSRGLSDTQAGILVDEEDEQQRKELREKLKADTDAARRGLAQPSPGERTDVATMETKVATILREARATASKIIQFGSQEAIAWSMEHGGKTPTRADADQLAVELAEKAFADQQLDPSAVAAAVQSMRSRLHTGSGPAGPSGAARKNPAFVPR